MHQMVHADTKILTGRFWHMGFCIAAIYSVPRASTNYTGFSISYFQMVLYMICNVLHTWVYDLTEIFSRCLICLLKTEFSWSPSDSVFEQGVWVLVLFSSYLLKGFLRLCISSAVILKAALVRCGGFLFAFNLCEQLNFCEKIYVLCSSLPYSISSAVNGTFWQHYIKRRVIDIFFMNCPRYLL